HVTGVQTCALPIWWARAPRSARAPPSRARPPPASSPSPGQGRPPSRTGSARRSSRNPKRPDRDDEYRGIQGASKMCGIVGAVAGRNVVPILIEGLRKLEYRGYDSAGLATLNGRIDRVRAVGRVADLAARASEAQANAPTGIAHTRWATHGGVTENN